MKPTRAWIEDWRLGERTSRENEISRPLVRIFASFWEAYGLDEMGKTTQRRYSNALHALGGYLVRRAVSENQQSTSARELLLGAIDSGDGPLIYHDNEAWQRELDAVCRKLHGYLETTC